MLQIGSRYFFDPTLNTSPEPHVKICCHVGLHVMLGAQDLGLV